MRCFLGSLRVVSAYKLTSMSDSAAKPRTVLLRKAQPTAAGGREAAQASSNGVKRTVLVSRPMHDDEMRGQVNRAVSGTLLRGPSVRLPSMECWFVPLRSTMTHCSQQLLLALSSRQHITVSFLQREGSRPTTSGNTKALFMEDAFPESAQFSAIDQGADFGLTEGKLGQEFAAQVPEPEFRGSLARNGDHSSSSPSLPSHQAVLGHEAGSDLLHPRERAASSALARTRAVARVQTAASAASRASLQTSAAIAVDRDARVRQRWDAQQRVWARHRASLAAKLQRPEESSVVAHADGFRARHEEVDLLEKAQPRDERHGAEGWQMNLRGGGTRYIQVGSVFSGLYVPVKDEVKPLAETVLRPGAKAAMHATARNAMKTALLSKDEHEAEQAASAAATTALSSLGATSGRSKQPGSAHGKGVRQDPLALKRASLQKNIAKIKPHEVGPDAADTLTALGVPLFEWARKDAGDILSATQGGVGGQAWGPSSPAGKRAGSPDSIPLQNGDSHASPPSSPLHTGEGGPSSPGLHTSFAPGLRGKDTFPGAALVGPYLRVQVVQDSTTLPGQPGAAMGPYGPEAGDCDGGVGGGTLGSSALSAVRGWPRVVMECSAGGDVAELTPAATRLPAGRVAVLGGSLAPASGMFDAEPGAVTQAWNSTARSAVKLGLGATQFGIEGGAGGVAFAGMAGAATQSIAALSLENVGSTALYYSWQRVDHGAVKALQDTLALPGESVEAARQSDLPGSSPHAGLGNFVCAQLKGSVAPGQAMTATFAFASPTPGVFRETWELRTVPPANGGRRLRVSLRGVATAEDESGPARGTLESKLQDRAAEHAVAEILEGLISRVKTPPAPPSPRAVREAQHRTFERHNTGLRYTPAVWDELQQLWVDAASCLGAYAEGRPVKEAGHTELPLTDMPQQHVAMTAAQFAASPFLPTPPKGVYMAPPEWDGRVLSIAQVIAELSPETVVALPLQPPPAPPAPIEQEEEEVITPKSGKKGFKGGKSSGRSKAGKGKGAAEEDETPPPPPPPAAETQIAVLAAWLRRRLATATLATRERDLRASPMYQVARSLICAVIDTIPQIASGAREAVGADPVPERDIELQLGTHDALIAHVHGKRGLWERRHAQRQSGNGDSRDERRRQRRKSRRDHRRVGLNAPTEAADDSDLSSESEWDSDTEANLQLEAGAGGSSGAPADDEAEDDADIEAREGQDAAFAAALAAAQGLGSRGDHFVMRPVQPVDDVAAGGGKGKKKGASKGAKSPRGAEDDVSSSSVLIPKYTGPPTLDAAAVSVPKASFAQGAVWAEEAIRRVADAAADVSDAARSLVQAEAMAADSAGGKKGGSKSSGKKSPKSGKGGAAVSDIDSVPAAALTGPAIPAGASTAAGAKMVELLQPILGEAVAQMAVGATLLQAAAAAAPVKVRASRSPRRDVLRAALPLVTSHVLGVFMHAVYRGPGAAARVASSLILPAVSEKDSSLGSLLPRSPSAAAGAMQRHVGGGGSSPEGGIDATLPAASNSLPGPLFVPSCLGVEDADSAPTEASVRDGYDALHVSGGVPGPGKAPGSIPHGAALAAKRTLLDVNTAGTLTGRVVVLRVDLDITQEMLEAAVKHIHAVGLPPVEDEGGLKGLTTRDTAAGGEGGSGASVGSRGSRQSRASRGSRLSRAVGGGATGAQAFDVAKAAARSSKVQAALASLKYIIDARAAAVVIVSAAGTARLPLAGDEVSAGLPLCTAPADASQGGARLPLHPPPAVKAGSVPEPLGHAPRTAGEVAHVMLGSSAAPSGVAPPSLGLGNLPIIWRKPVTYPPAPPTPGDLIQLALSRAAGYHCLAEAPWNAPWDAPLARGLLGDANAVRPHRGPAGKRAVAVAAARGDGDALPPPLARDVLRALPCAPAGGCKGARPVLSLAPVAAAIAKLLGRPVQFLHGGSVDGSVSSPGDVLTSAQAVIRKAAAAAMEELAVVDFDQVQGNSQGDAEAGASAQRERAVSVGSRGSRGSRRGAKGARKEGGGLSAGVATALAAAEAAAAAAPGMDSSPTRVLCLENILSFAPVEELGQVGVAAVTGQRSLLPHGTGLSLCDSVDVQDWQPLHVALWVASLGRRSACADGLQSLALAMAEKGVQGGQLLTLGHSRLDHVVENVWTDALESAKAMAQAAADATARAARVICMRKGGSPEEMQAQGAAAAAEVMQLAGFPVPDEALSEGQQEGKDAHHEGKDAQQEGKDGEGGVEVAHDPLARPSMTIQQALALLPSGRAALEMATAAQAELQRVWGTARNDAELVAGALAQLRLRAEAEAQWRFLDGPTSEDSESGDAISAARRTIMARVVALRGALSALGDVIVLDSLSVAHAAVSSVVGAQPRPERTASALDAKEALQAIVLRGDLAAEGRSQGMSHSDPREELRFAAGAAQPLSHTRVVHTGATVAGLPLAQDLALLSVLLQPRSAPALTASAGAAAEASERTASIDRGMPPGMSLLAAVGSGTDASTMQTIRAALFSGTTAASDPTSSALVPGARAPGLVKTLLPLYSVGPWAAQGGYNGFLGPLRSIRAAERVYVPRPLVAVLGGSGAHLLQRAAAAVLAAQWADRIVLGGLLGAAWAAHVRGVPMGDTCLLSREWSAVLPLLRRLAALARARGVPVIAPLDAVVGSQRPPLASERGAGAEDDDDDDEDEGGAGAFEDEDEDPDPEEWDSDDEAEVEAAQAAAEAATEALAVARSAPVPTAPPLAKVGAPCASVAVEVEYPGAVGERSLVGPPLPAPALLFRLKAAAMGDDADTPPADDEEGGLAAAQASLQAASWGLHEGEVMLDVGPSTREVIEETLASAGSVVMMGPLGACEAEDFANGTREALEAAAGVCKRGGLAVLAGGSLVAWAKVWAQADSMSWLLPGGEATRAVFAGQLPPGVAMLDDVPGSAGNPLAGLIRANEARMATNADAHSAAVAAAADTPLTPLAEGEAATEESQ